MGVEIKLEAEAVSVVGISLSFPEFFKGYGVTPKDCLLGALLFQLGAGHIPGEPLLAINMPCGSHVEYRVKDDLPDGNTPCPCGSESHSIIKFQWNESKPD